MPCFCHLSQDDSLNLEFTVFQVSFPDMPTQGSSCLLSAGLQGTRSCEKHQLNHVPNTVAFCFEAQALMNLGLANCDLLASEAACLCLLSTGGTQHCACSAA